MLKTLKTKSLTLMLLNYAVALAEMRKGFLTDDPNIANDPNQTGAPPFINVTTGTVWIWGPGSRHPNTFNRETGQPWVFHGPGGQYEPAFDHGQGGPIIERERIATAPGFLVSHPNIWSAWTSREADDSAGKSKLEAAMRCYVHSVFGDEITIDERVYFLLSDE